MANAPHRTSLSFGQIVFSGTLSKTSKVGAEPQTQGPRREALWMPVDSTGQVFSHFPYFFNQNQKARRIHLEYLELRADSTHINTDRMHSSSYVRGKRTRN